VDVFSDSLEVTPGLPAAIGASLSPQRRVYTRTEVLEVVVEVTDEYGNTVQNPPLAISGSQPIRPFGGTSFRPTEEGSQSVTVSVDGPTLGGRTLEARVSFVVDENAPVVECTFPSEGSLRAGSRPGQSTTIQGRFQDGSGIASLTVAGTDARLSFTQGRRAGTFSATVTAREGVNAVPIVAIDGYGQTTHHLCHFLVGRGEVHVTEFLEDAVTLTLGQDAIDDHDRRDRDSIGDFLDEMLNSDGLNERLFASIRDAHYDGGHIASAGQHQSCNWLRVGIEDARIGDTRTIGLSLRGDEIIVAIRFDRIQVRLSAWGELLCFDQRARGSVVFHNPNVVARLAVSFSAGRPRLRVRNVTVQFSDLSRDLDSWFDNWLFDRAQPGVVQAVRSKAGAALKEVLEDAIDGLLSRYGTTTLARRLEIPRPDGQRFAIDGSTVLTSASQDQRGIHLGIGSKFRATRPVVTRGSGLIPLPADARAETTHDGARSSVRLGVTNQMLYALWQAGYFRGDRRLDGGRVQVEALSQPVVTVVGDDRIQIALGGIQGSMYLNGFGEIATVRGNASVTARVTRRPDGRLALTSPSVDIQAVFPGTPLSQQQQDLATGLLELYLAGQLQTAFQQLPALPVEYLVTPSGLEDFGIEPGRQIGIVFDDVDIRPGHRATLDGRLQF
jgi:hypothetical protein